MSLTAFRDLMPADREWTEADWQAFRDLTAMCRAMREAWPVHGDGGVECTRSERIAPVSRQAGAVPARRQPKVTAGSLPTVPGFWQKSAALYDAAVPECPGEGYELVRHPSGVYEWIDAHRLHRKRSVDWLMTNCRPCGESKVRWMAAQPEASHAGRNGRRLAKVFGL